MELQPKTNSSDDTQTWIRGKTNSKGYFTLQSKAHGKLLTLVTSSRIILAGTIFILILNIQDKIIFHVISKKWYFVTKIVVTYCEKKNVLVIKKNFFSNFSCMFLNPKFFPNLNSDCSKLLDLRNLLERGKKHSVIKNCCDLSLFE